MIKFSPYISIYGFRQEYERLTEVVWSFSKNLKGIARQNLRVNIHLVDSLNAERKHLEGAIKSIWEFYDQASFSTYSDQKKRETLLRLIARVLLDVADELKWDRSKIEEALDKSLLEDSRFSYVSRNHYTKLRKNRASIKLLLIGDKVSVFAIIMNARGDVLDEVLMIDTFAMYVSWFRTFNDVKWIDEDTFGFCFPNDIHLIYSIPRKKVEWKHQESDGDLGFVKSVTYREFLSEEEMLRWMNS